MLVFYNISVFLGFIINLIDLNLDSIKLLIKLNYWYIKKKFGIVVFKDIYLIVVEIFKFF